MQPEASKAQNNCDLQLIVVLVLTAMIIFHLTAAYRGVGICREQHLATAVEYARGKIDLLRPVIVGANVNGAPTPLEFPLFQASTAAVMKMFGLWYGWGNVVALIFHLLTLWPIYQLGRRMYSERAGWWAVTIFVIQPLSFIWGGMAGADSLAMMSSIWFVYLTYRMMHSGHPGWWFASILAGALSATTKAPFFFVAGLTSFLWLIHVHRGINRAWLQLATVGILSTIVFAVWNHHSNNCYKEAEFLNYDFGIGTSTAATAWWFGDLSSRLDLRSWMRGAWRISLCLTGSISLIILPLVGWLLNSSNFLRYWVYAGMAAVLIFTNVVLMHWHYFYIFSVPVALLAARGAIELEPLLWRHFRRTPVRIALYSSIGAVALAQGLRNMHPYLLLDRFPIEMATVMNQQTAPGDKLVVWGGAWTTPLMRVTRPAYSLYNWELITNPVTLARLKELGYNRLILLNHSPLQIAVNRISGTKGPPERDLPAEIPPVARGWKAIYSTPSIIILDIPK